MPIPKDDGPLEIIMPEMIENWKKHGINEHELDKFCFALAMELKKQITPGPTANFIMAIEVGAAMYRQLLMAGLNAEILMTLNKRIGAMFNKFADNLINQLTKNDE